MSERDTDTSREAIERKAKSLRWQRSEFNADDREALEAADALLALLARAEAAESELKEALSVVEERNGQLDRADTELDAAEEPCWR